MNNPYAELGVTAQATQAELKAAYRRLVKQHHPDAGGDPERILALNAAWELVGDAERRRQFDRNHAGGYSGLQADAVAEARRRGARNARASRAASAASGQGAAADDALVHWLQTVYAPVDRQLGQVINPFPARCGPCRLIPTTTP